MASVTSSDALLRFVVWIGQIVILLDLGLLAVLFWMRMTLLARERHQHQFLSIWRPLLMESLMERPKHFPRIQTRADWLLLLTLWNYLHESVRGELQENLNQAGRVLGVDQQAQRMLHKPSSRDQLLAIATLGNLREQTAWTDLQRLVTATNPFVSLAAARSLVLLDARAAIPLITPLIRDRTDWSITGVARLLNEAGTEIVAIPLAQVLIDASPEQILRIIRYLEAMRATQALQTIRHLLPSLQEPDAIAACLRFLGRIGDDQDLDRLRHYTYHSSWYIRVHAVSALGKIGVQADCDRLVELLADEEWWVRYRAAQALANLPFIDLSDLEQIRAQQPDPETREILAEIIEQKRQLASWHLTQF